MAVQDACGAFGIFGVSEDRSPAEHAETGGDHVAGLFQTVAGVHATLAQPVLNAVDHVDLAQAVAVIRQQGHSQRDAEALLVLLLEIGQPVAQSQQELVVRFVALDVLEHVGGADVREYDLQVGIQHALLDVLEFLLQLLARRGVEHDLGADPGTDHVEVAAPGEARAE